MGKSIHDLDKERRYIFNTEKNTFADFPIGTRVRNISLGVDFLFFTGDETGVVVENKMGYLGIIVRFDKKTEPQQFNFNPTDLVILERPLPKL